MGLLATVAGPLTSIAASTSTTTLVLAVLALLLVLSLVLNVLHQLLFRDPSEPPVVFHWLPVIGSTITYGIDPYRFFFSCREKYGDVFTFILLGRKTTVCLGTRGNDFILNGKLADLNAEEIYSPLTTPVFGKDVVYDVPNAKLMEQKKFVKFGLTSSALQSYVRLISSETRSYLSERFQGPRGTVDVVPAMAELTIYTASRSLQGKEVRSKFDSSFADLYHDLDMGFTPINFMLPWAPLPQNRKRDAARNKMADTYTEIVEARRRQIEEGKEEVGEREEDMIWNLMACKYKDGRPLADHEIAHMMIALLMAGQHSSSSTSSWILLRLATRPDLQDELYAEMEEVLGVEETVGEDGTKSGRFGELTHEKLQMLKLNAQVVKETLRLHAPIHSIMRKVTSPLQISTTIPSTHEERPYNIPTSHVLMAAPGVTSKLAEHFPQPELWEPHRWDPVPASVGNGDEVNNVSGMSEKSGEKYAALRAIATEDDKDEKVDYGYGLVSKGAGSPYLPFGAGRHRCIGEQFAYVQLGTILCEIVEALRWTNVGGKKEVVGTDFSSLFSRPLTPAIIEWERRGGAAA